MTKLQGKENEDYDATVRREWRTARIGAVCLVIVLLCGLALLRLLY